MAFFLVNNGVVVQKQPHAGEGFVEGPDDVVCGFTYADGVFSPPVVPAPNLSDIDQATMNEALSADGSIVRAITLLMFAEVNKLRVKTGDPAYTLAQFKTALKAQMR